MNIDDEYMNFNEWLQSGIEKALQLMKEGETDDDR